MLNRPTRDEWLLPTLESLLGPEAITQLRPLVRDSYWEAAVGRGLVRDEELLAALAERYRMRIANLSLVSPQARELVPEQLARRYRILPLSATEATLEIATADPNDLDCERTLGFATGRTIRMSLASPSRLAERIEEVYRPDNVVDKILETVGARYDVQTEADAPSELSDLDLGADRASDRPIIRLVDHILAEGISSRASDIHIEPEEADVAVRYRIDGVLREAMTLPRAVGIPLVSRVKIISGLDIADRLRPQDGRARVAVNGIRVDLRVSTLPASQGEKVVIRILDQRATVPALEGMGLNADELQRVRQLLGTREGIILVTGPTGSGKTTTLYSLLRHIQDPGVNIVTVEDPVEYKLPGIVQVQVNERTGLTFAAALRSILRQDPDVVLVGEIRDRETATIAVQASLTGHLVLSTLHTIDAVGSIPRLIDIGVESYKIAAAVKGVIAQRLLRRLCPHCREPITGGVPERLRRWVPEGATICRAVGCPECSMTGYRGRLAIMEVMLVGPEVERRIAGGESVDRIATAAAESGTRSLWESGVSHILRGETSLEELMRVVEAPIDHPSRERGYSSAPSRPSRATPVGGASVVSRTGGRVLDGSDARPFSGAAFQLREELQPALPAHEAGNGRSTVLLVEDDAQLRTLLRGILEHEGYAVLEAGDGVQALETIDREAPDALVLDIDLPRLDGYGVLRHLRSRAQTATLPVLVLTGQLSEDSEVQVLQAGADDYLSKPLRARALGARLRLMLDRG